MSSAEYSTLISQIYKKETQRHVLLVLLGWQCVAFLLAAINVFSDKLAHNWQTPTLNNAPMYLMLAIITFIRSCIWKARSPNHYHYKITDPFDDGHCPRISRRALRDVLPINDAANTMTVSLQQQQSGFDQSYQAAESSNFTETDVWESTQRSESKSNRTFLDVLLRRQANTIPSFYYFLAALADVEGNVLMLTAYEYTTITSVTLLDCFVIPMVMGWGIVVFGRRYQCHHYIGITICLLGMGLLVYTDSIEKNKSNHSGSNPVLGDVLVLCGAVCYSISNTFNEYAVKHNQSIWEYLRMIGLFGFVITMIQGLIVEHEPLINENVYSTQSLLYLLGYVSCMSMYYVAIPSMLQYSSAVVYNLSLLSTDFWSVLAGVVLFSQQITSLYFVAFVITLVGVAYYNVANHKYRSTDN